MKSTEHWLVHEHTQFEVMLRELQRAAEITDWWAMDQYLLKLVEQLRYHMAQEEEVLFPAYDSKCEFSVIRLPSVSTEELYGEHSIIVEKIRKLAKCIHDKDADSVISHTASLELLLLEHNEKEEQIFLPYASRLLFEDREKLEKKLEDFSVTDASRDWGI